MFVQTQKAIKIIKFLFEYKLSSSLNLIRISSPKFIKTGTGIQDDLAGTCESIKFNINNGSTNVEIVHSLAKWKRLMLLKNDFPVGCGIYTDMDAIRKDEQLDQLHSAYVDQWDWEIVINRADRNEFFLRDIVNKIYAAILETHNAIHKKFDNLPNINKLPPHITFIHSNELLDMYPSLTPEQRECEIARIFGAVFIIGIGYPLGDGRPHGIRAADYDDWSSFNDNYRGLNGDIIFWNDVLQCPIEISSMGIRVNSHSLALQSEIMNVKCDSDFHKIIMNDVMYTMGGGIGQSRLCMFILEKEHIGQVQVSEWPDDVYSKFADIL